MSLSAYLPIALPSPESGIYPNSGTGKIDILCPRFFVSTSDPTELTLSQNGNSFEVLKTGDELEVINSTVQGTTQEVQYNLSKGGYELKLW